MKKIYNVFLLLISFILATPDITAQVNFPYDLDQVIQTVEAKKSNGSKLSLGLDKLARLGMDSYLAESLIIRDGMVKVLAIPANNPILLKNQLELQGGKCTLRNGVVCGWFPIDQLTELEDMPNLKGIMGEFKPYLKVGATTSQGDRSMLSDLAREEFGVDGSGITIGVISDSYDALGRAANGVASGDLPGAGNPNGFTTPVDVLSEIASLPAGSDEGRGMAEIIHDVAPGAAMQFYSASNGYFDFADGILALQAAGSDVIVDDIGYFAEPYFQDGTIAQAVTQVASLGAAYFSAAGNSDRLSYEAPFSASGADIGFGEFHDFGGGDFFQRIVVPPGQTMNYWLQWDDPSIYAAPPGAEFYEGPAPEADYDMYLLDAITGDLVDFSVFINPDDLFPIEFVGFQNTTGAPVELDLMIVKFSGPDRYLKYIDRGSGIFPAEYNTFSGTSVGHPMAEGGFGIAAAAYFNTAEFGNRPSDVNGFSSTGGVPIIIDADGSRLSAPVVREQPFLTGPDGGNTTDFPPPDLFGLQDVEGDGFPNFFGTSAAAPHVAAVAALLLEASGGMLSPAEIGQILSETAEDLDDAFTPGFDVGYDFTSGYGMVQADAAIASLEDMALPYRFVLWDANANMPLFTIRPGDVINQQNLPLRSTIQVLVSGEFMGPVAVSLEGPISVERTEKTPPYTLFGNKGSKVNGRFFPQGSYTVSADVSGGGSYEVPFTIIGVNPQLLGFELVDAETDMVIGPLTEGMVIDKDTYPGDLNIKTTGASPFVESVKLVLEGALEENTRENTAPYSIFGNNGFDYFGEPLPVGSYSITATPYARNNNLGAKGDPISVNFTVAGSETETLLVLREVEGQGGLANLLNDRSELNVYPNPGTGPMTVELPHLENNERIQIWLSDVSGRQLDLGMLVQDGGQQFTLNPSTMNLAPGVYFLHARTDSRTFPAVKLALHP